MSDNNDCATRERCLWLKKALLHLVVAEEMTEFHKNPNFIAEHRDGVLGLSRAKFLEVPIVAARVDKVGKALDEWLRQFTELSTLYYRATGKDFTKRLANGVVGNLHVAIRTPTERQMRNAEFVASAKSSVKVLKPTTAGPDSPSSSTRTTTTAASASATTTSASNLLRPPQPAKPRKRRVLSALASSLSRLSSHSDAEASHDEDDEGDDDYDENDEEDAGTTERVDAEDDRSSGVSDNDYQLLDDDLVRDTGIVVLDNEDHDVPDNNNNNNNNNKCTDNKGGTDNNGNKDDADDDDGFELIDSADARPPPPPTEDARAASASAASGSRGRKRREFIDAFAALMLTKEKDGTLASLVNVIMAAHHTSELPPQYRLLFDLQRAMALTNIDDMSPDDIQRVRRSYSSTPRRAIMALLKLTSPATLLSGLVTLVTTKRLGSRSQLQKWLAAAVDARVVDQRLEQARAGVHESVAARLRDYVDRVYPFPAPPFDHASVSAILSNNQLAPTHGVDTDALHAVLTDAHYAYGAWMVLWYDVRARDNNTFLEALGRGPTEQLIAQLIPAVQEPLGGVLNAGGLPSLVSTCFSAWGAIIRVLANDSLSAQQRRTACAPFVDNIVEAIYAFIRRAIVLDNGTLLNLLEWLLGSWAAQGGTGIDVHALFVSQLPSEEQQAVWAEVDAYRQASEAKSSKSGGRTSEADGAGVEETQGTTTQQDGGAEKAAPEQLYHRGSMTQTTLDTVRRTVLPSFRDHLRANLRAAAHRRHATTTGTETTREAPQQRHGEASEEEEEDDDDDFCVVETTPSGGVVTAQPRVSMALIDDMAAPPHDTDYITHIEVLAGNESTHTVRARGFHRLPLSCNPGALSRNTHIWFKRTPLDELREGNWERQMQPVVEVRVGDTPERVALCRSQRFNAVGRPVNCGTLVGALKVRLWYRRGPPGEQRPLCDLSLMRNDDRPPCELEHGWFPVAGNLNIGNLGATVTLWARRGRALEL